LFKITALGDDLRLGIDVKSPARTHAITTHRHCQLEVNAGFGNEPYLPQSLNLAPPIWGAANTQLRCRGDRIDPS
jgi:hypothetical protein